MKVTEIIGDYEAQFGKRRVVFKVEGNTNAISGFFKFPPKVGDELDGEIVQKNGYYNFKFSDKTHVVASPTYQPTPDINRVEKKLDVLITEQQMLRGLFTEMKGVMSSILRLVDKDHTESTPF